MHEGGWEAWHDFFVLTGTAAVTLTGLLFVVVSMGVRAVSERSAAGMRAFVTPNIYHLGAVFVVSAVYLGPDLTPRVLGGLLTAGALASFAYLLYTRVHTRWSSNRLPPIDWVWYVAAPWGSYALCLVTGVACVVHEAWSTHVVAIAVILLIVTAIRNAWDLILWMRQQEQAVTSADRVREG
jgi:hypothetical protein